MSKNPFKDRPKESKNRNMLRIGQRVLVVEKHNQGSKNLTDCYIESFLTSKNFHPQGVKVIGLRKSYLEGVNISEIDPRAVNKKISTRAGELDINKYCVGRVQFLEENLLNIDLGDIVIISRTKKKHLEKDMTEGVVVNIVQYELVDGVQKTQVELADGTIGWVYKVIEKI